MNKMLLNTKKDHTDDTERSMRWMMMSGLKHIVLDDGSYKGIGNWRSLVV